MPARHARRRVPVRVLTAALLFLSAAAASRAETTYYVSPRGDDAADGKAAASAWKTVARVGAAALAPGDQVLFERGGEWREQLKAGASGAAGRPIVYAAYGKGAKPKFWGGDVLDPKDFRPVGGDVYQFATAATIYAVLIDHHFLRNAGRAAGGADPVAYVKEHPRSWLLAGGLLTVNTGGPDPRGNAAVCTAVARDDLVHTNQKDHLVFRDLVTDESARPDAGYGFRVFGSADVRLEGCEAYRAGKHHFGVIDSTEFVGQDLYAAYAMPDQGVGGAAPYVSYSDRTRKGDSSRYVRCVCEHLEDAGTGGTYPAFVTHGEGVGSIRLEDFTSRGGEIALDNGESGASIRVQGGVVEDGVLRLAGKGIVADGTSLLGERTEVILGGSDNVVQNLRVLGCNPGFAGYPAAITDRGRGNTIRFCTVVMGDGAKDFDAALALVRPGSGLRWYGNILLAPGVAVRAWFAGFDPARYESSYNFYRKGAQFDTRFEKQGRLHSLDQWRGAGLDSGSLEGDPRFADPARGDYSLSPDSPAVDAAKLDRGLLEQIPADAAGKPRLQGKAFDMGAYERRP